MNFGVKFDDSLSIYHSVSNFVNLVKKDLILINFRFYKNPNFF
jgi:hypothetical protein